LGPPPLFVSEYIAPNREDAPLFSFPVFNSVDLWEDSGILPGPDFIEYSSAKEFPHV